MCEDHSTTQPSARSHSHVFCLPPVVYPLYLRYHRRRVNDLMAKVLADVPLPARSAGAGKAKKSKAVDDEPTATSADADAAADEKETPST